MVSMAPMAASTEHASQDARVSAGYFILSSSNIAVHASYCPYVMHGRQLWACNCNRKIARLAGLAAGVWAAADDDRKGRVPDPRVHHLHAHPEHHCGRGGAARAVGGRAAGVCRCAPGQASCGTTVGLSQGFFCSIYLAQVERDGPWAGTLLGSANAPPIGLLWQIRCAKVTELCVDHDEVHARLPRRQHLDQRGPRKRGHPGGYHERCGYWRRPDPDLLCCALVDGDGAPEQARAVFLARDAGYRKGEFHSQAPTQTSGCSRRNLKLADLCSALVYGNMLCTCEADISTLCWRTGLHVLGILILCKKLIAALCGAAAHRDGGVLRDVAGHNHCGVCGEPPPAHRRVGGLPGPHRLGCSALAGPGCAPRKKTILRKHFALIFGKCEVRPHLQ